MNVIGHIVIPREDTVEYIEEIGFKHLMSNYELADLAVDNMDEEQFLDLALRCGFKFSNVEDVTDKEYFEMVNNVPLDEAIKVLNQCDFAVVQITN